MEGMDCWVNGIREGIRLVSGDFVEGYGIKCRRYLYIR